MQKPRLMILRKLNVSCYTVSSHRKYISNEAEFMPTPPPPPPHKSAGSSPGISNRDQMGPKMRLGVFDSSDGIVRAGAENQSCKLR